MGSLFFWLHPVGRSSQISLRRPHGMGDLVDVEGQFAFYGWRGAGRYTALAAPEGEQAGQGQQAE